MKRPPFPGELQSGGIAGQVSLHPVHVDPPAGLLRAETLHLGIGAVGIGYGGVSAVKVVARIRDELIRLEKANADKLSAERMASSGEARGR